MSDTSCSEVVDMAGVLEEESVVDLNTPLIWQQFVYHILSIRGDNFNFGINMFAERVKPSHSYNQALREDMLLQKQGFPFSKLNPYPQVFSDSQQPANQTKETADANINHSKLPLSSDSHELIQDKDNTDNLAPIAETHREPSTASKHAHERRKLAMQPEHKKTKPQIEVEDTHQPVNKQIEIIHHYNGNRPHLYKRYLDKPDDWRRGLSLYTVSNYKYIFQEADNLRKEIKWNKGYGSKSKLPNLYDRLHAQQQRQQTVNAIAGSRKNNHMTVDFSSSKCDISAAYCKGQIGISGSDKQRPLTSSGRRQINRNNISNRPKTAV